MENEKNFRSSYYTKVGFRMVEERKSIEAFLSPKVDLVKIRLFLKSYTLPEVHRLRVWRLLLDIAEPETEDQLQLRQLHCDQLSRSVIILAPPGSITSEAHQIALMVILARGDAKQSIKEQFVSKQALNAHKLATCLINICPQSFVEYFYMVNGLVRLLEEQTVHFLHIKDEALQLLQKEQPDLFDHITRFDINQIIYDLLYSCFAQVLDVPLIIKVWDKVIGGYFRQIMPKLTAAYFTALKGTLLQAKDQEQFVDCFKQPLASDKNDLIIDYI